MSGISIAFTKMDHVIWNHTPNNTNVGESAHANVNHDGCNLSLLAGIIRYYSYLFYILIDFLKYNTL